MWLSPMSTWVGRLQQWLSWTAKLAGQYSFGNTVDCPAVPCGSGALTWGRVVTLWLLLGDLEGRRGCCSSSSRNRRLLLELRVGCTGRHTRQCILTKLQLLTGDGSIPSQSTMLFKIISMVCNASLWSTIIKDELKTQSGLEGMHLPTPWCWLHHQTQTLNRPFL